MNDLISRQAVDELSRNLVHVTRDKADFLCNFWEGLQKLPPVTPAPKKCHNENKDYDDCDQFVCSNCGIELQDWHSVERSEDGDITYHEYEFHFCPNCGAKIGGE